MNKIYTFVKKQALVASVLSLALFSTGAYSQSICGPIVENFDNTGNSTAGFTGDFTYMKVGTDGFLNRNTVIASAIYTITTPTYQLAASTNFLGFGFELDGTEKVARVEAAVIYVSTLNNQLTTIFIDQFVPTYSQSLPSKSVVCRAISTNDLPGFPAGGKYRLRFEFTSNTGSGMAGQTINFDDFRTNGTLAQAPLPVNFIGFEARKATGGVQLTWKVAGEENVARYEVERSTDGRTFATIATIARTGKDTYTFLDTDNANTTVYYRVKNVDNNATFKYSSIARFANGKSTVVIKTFPQPVQNQLTVQHPAVQSQGLITVSTADGRVVRSIKPAAGAMQTYVDMSNLQKGLYVVRFDTGDGTTETVKVVKQ